MPGNDMDAALLSGLGLTIRYQHHTPNTVKKKSKKRQAEPGAKSDDEDLSDSEIIASKKPKTSVQATIHPIILKPRPVTMKARKKTTPPPEELIQSPFFMQTDSSIDEFYNLLADRLHTTTSNIAIDRLQWKFEKPKNAQCKPLVDLNGFSAMLQAITGKRDTERVIHVYLPLPKADPNTHDDEDDEDVVEYPQINSLHAQKANIDKTCEPTMRALEEKYPIDNHPLFPGKRIYEQGRRFWELTPLRLQIWAIGIMNDRATLDAPPTSAHFDVSKCIRPATPAIGVTPDGPPSNVTPILPQPSIPAFYGTNAAVQGAQISPPTPMPGYPPFYPGMYHYPPFYGTPHGFPPIAPAVGTSVEPEIVALPRPISLEEFCQYYKISESDREKLLVLEVELGDRRCEQLSEAEWKVEAKFSKLAWDRFKNKHARFCDDVMKGIWDTTDV